MYIYAFHEATFMSFMLYAICMCVFQSWVFLALQVNAGDILDLPPPSNSHHQDCYIFCMESL